MIVLVGASLLGCATPNKSFWSEMHDGQGKVVTPYEHDPATFSKRLRVIEFDEQGDFWNPKQVRAARDMIDSCARPLVITYIHGWQNNGKPTNADLQSFNEFLVKLEKEGISKRMQVCGVFIAWRGEGVEPFFPKINIPRYLTFWSRKSATERVAGIPLSRTLTLLCEDAHRNNGKVILIGHSFGARVLERTFGQWLAVEGSRNKEFQSLADLVVLINPASESLYAYQLKLALKNRPPEYRPVIVSITSQSDSATKDRWAQSAFARLLVKGGNEFRPYYRGPERTREGQYSYVEATAGHDKRQFTHWLKEVPLQGPLKPRNMLSSNISRAKQDYFFIRAQDESHKTYCLEPIPPDKGPGDVWQTPVGGYWVFQVPDDILHEHGGKPETGGIFNPQMVDLLGAVMKISNPNNSTTPPTLTLAPVENR